MGSIEAGSSEPWLAAIFSSPISYRYQSHRVAVEGGTEPTVLAAFSPSPGRVTQPIEE